MQSSERFFIATRYIYITNYKKSTDTVRTSANNNKFFLFTRWRHAVFPPKTVKRVESSFPRKFQPNPLVTVSEILVTKQHSKT